MSGDAFQTLDTGSLVVRLRDGLRFVPQRFGDEVVTVIEDEATGRCFRVGQDVASLLAALDGRRTLGEALAIVAADGTQALDESDAIRIVGWIVENELAETATSGRAERLAERRRRKARLALPAKLNPIAIRVPLLDPDPALRPLDWLGRMLFSWPAALTLLMLLASAARVLIERGDEMLAGRPPLTSPRLWILVAASGAVLKLLHEMAHGMACRRIGGRPRQAGVLLLLLAPLPFVDVTAAWACPSKWRRMLVSAAGMLIEVAVAAAAVLWWDRTSSPELRETLLATITAATVVTVLFNANPLMKFDGYYLLADWLELPNLAPRSRNVVAGLCGRWFLGLRYRLTERRWPTLLVYGLAAAAWKVVVWVSILTACCLLFGEVGRLLAGVTVALSLGRMLWRSTRRVAFRKPAEEPVRLLRVSGWAAAGVAVAAAIGHGLERPASVTAAGVVVPAESVPVRARTAGIVVAVLVEDGQTVAAGDAIAVVEDETLLVRRRSLEVDRAANRLAARGHQLAGEIAARLATDDALHAIDERLAEIDRRLDERTIRTMHAGRIAWPRPDDWIGRHVQPGTPIARIDADGPQELVALVPQSEAARWADMTDWSIQVDGSPASHDVASPTLAATLSRSLPHDALGAHAGGEAAVVADAEGHQRLAQPSVELRLAMPEATDTAVPIGLRATLTGRGSHRLRDDLLLRWAALTKPLR